MPDIDEMWEKFLDSASRHHKSEEEIKAFVDELELEPVGWCNTDEYPECTCW